MKKKLKCYYLEHHKYVNPILGYLVKPCCRARTDEHVQTIQEISNSKQIKEIKDSFAKGIKHKACYQCWNNEKLKLPSKRKNAMPKFKNAKGIEDWDIRPENTCNLKCIMCDPHQSSKWFEDIDIYNNTFATDLSKQNLNATETDWEYITKNTINKAKRIYIAGGEPFYMKKAIKFLQILSEYEWNRKNTLIDIQTNGISFDDTTLELIDKFNLQHIGFSIDGWSKVNEIIRFPTNWKTLYNNFTYFEKNYRNVSNKSISVNITISALNLPDIPNLLGNLNVRTHMHELYNPEILHINSLKPSVIQSLKKSTKNIFLRDLMNKYEYNEKNNIKMKEYLSALDKKRGTDSVAVLPWCWV